VTDKKIEFNEQQKDAIAAAVNWYKGFRDGKHNRQVFFLSGYAGTGKTSCSQTISELCAPPHRIAYIAPTGKAASRLRQKGCKNAKTLHQLIYNVRGEDEEGDPIFIGKGSMENQPLLIVCDEASMLGEYDNKTLLQFGIPVLALGDTGQVEPVKAAAAYTEGNVDFQLTEIMRQAGDSNIIRASMFVRQGKRLPLREYEDVRVREGQPSDADLIEHCAEDAQIICARNDTRRVLNRRCRELLGFKGDIPMIGEKIVCTFNQHDHHLMNGETGIVLGYEQAPDYQMQTDNDDDGLRVRLKSLTDGRERRVMFKVASFSSDAEVATAAMKSKGGFDYGNALTIHKSQGSEWPKVLVMEEALRGQYAKLMYTAYTRAQEQLTVYRAK
jgi:exodeoxyribonuclease V